MMTNRKPLVISSAMGGNIGISEFLKPICEKLGMEFKTMSEWPQHDIRWQKDTWLRELDQADIVVCVARHDVQPAKSANRAVQAMSMGKPVVVSPLPAYLSAVNNGVTGFICDTPSEWEASLALLKDPALRKKMGSSAKESVKRYSMEEVGFRFKKTIEMLAFENSRPPKVDIIIPTYNNLEYLKVCVESIRRVTDWPHNIIVVSSGDKDGTNDWLKAQADIIRVISKERFHFSKANNEGLKVSKEGYACLLNDDTIVGKGWLTAMMHEAMKPGVGVVGPFSNCDRTWLHDEAIIVNKRELVPGMKMDEVKDFIPDLQAYSHAKEIHPRKWLAFYCVVIPQGVIDKVGLLDEGFLSGDEDLDYCKRVADKGYRILQTWDSWVFHFGGKTRKKADDADHDRHQREDMENHAYFFKKWGVMPGDQQFRNKMVLPVAMPKPPAPPSQKKDDRPLVGIYTGPAYERWNPLSLEEGGIGGSETATVYTARDFARKGFRTVVFGDCQGREGTFDGVEYIHHSKVDAFVKANKFHFFVSSRRPEVFGLNVNADRKAYIVHDIWLSQDPNAQLYQDKVDRFFVLSEWHKKFFLDHHKQVPPEKAVVSRDGVDLERFKKPMPRERGRMVYSSSPDRGLDVLLHCLPRIRKEVPEANVHVFYGFSNWEKACLQRWNKDEIAWMEDIKAKLDNPGVVYRGRVGQAQLAKEMMKAEIFAYPTYFSETFCITAVEQMAAGNPVVTTRLAGLETTVGNHGVLLDGEPRSAVYQEKFIAEVVRMLTDRNRWSRYSQQSIKKASKYSWTGIADEWLSLVGLGK